MRGFPEKAIRSGLGASAGLNSLNSQGRHGDGVPLEPKRLLSEERACRMRVSGSMYRRFIEPRLASEIAERGTQIGH